MTDPQSLQYMFRKPMFPIVCDLSGYVIGARTHGGFLKKLAEFQFERGPVYNVIDSTGEGWGLYSDLMVVSPLVLKKRWTKIEIIRMYNNRKNKKGECNQMYSEKSLSSKRFERILNDIIELTLEA